MPTSTIYPRQEPTCLTTRTPYLVVVGAPLNKNPLLPISCTLFSLQSQNYCNIPTFLHFLQLPIPVHQVFNFSITGPTFFQLDATRDNYSTDHFPVVSLNIQTFLETKPRSQLNPSAQNPVPPFLLPYPPISRRLNFP